MLRATLVGILFIGCDAGAPPRLGSVPEGDPAELEPGYVVMPSLLKWRPPRTVPRCRSIEPRMSWSPAIEILSSGGMAGGGTGNVQIWEDGTVMFDGAGCPDGMHRRGKMSPARVRAIIDVLEAAQFFTWSCNEEVRCFDSFMTSLTVQRGGVINTVFDPGCDSSQPNLAAQAIELVMQAVGKNACSPECGATPAPELCR